MTDLIHRSIVDLSLDKAEFCVRLKEPSLMAYPYQALARSLTLAKGPYSVSCGQRQRHLEQNRELNCD
jgi:hypothetical protein